MTQCDPDSFNEDMKAATAVWVKRLQANDAAGVSDLFCTGDTASIIGQGRLLGTVSHTLRGVTPERPGIRDYFDYFANRKNIKVVQSEMYPQAISCDVGVNNVFATIEDDVNGSVDTQMSYVWRKDSSKDTGMCLALLHSSVVPSRHEPLYGK